MKTEMIPARDIVAGVRAAFRGAASCHCHTVAKLGEEEVLNYLARQGVVTLGDIHGINAITIELLWQERHHGGFGKITNATAYALTSRVKYLADLQEFTFGDLLAIPEMGRAAARSVERVMAEFGLLLKDGDPAFLEAVREEKQAEGRLPAPPSDQSPEDIRITTARALIELGATMMRDGVSLTMNAAKIASGEPRIAAFLRSYITQHSKVVVVGEEVARIVAPFLALEASEKSRRPSRSDRPAKVEEPVPQIEHLQNVVTGVFAEAASNG